MSVARQCYTDKYLLALAVFSKGKLCVNRKLMTSATYKKQTPVYMILKTPLAASRVGSAFGNPGSVPAF